MFSVRQFFAMMVVALIALLSQSTTTAFTSPATTTTRSLATDIEPSSTRLNFFGPKDDGSPGDYVCMDCGWVFTKGPKAWADLPNDWSCPPCGSVKRRFKKVAKGSAGK